MKKSRDKLADGAELRRRAEERLKRRSPGGGGHATEAQAARLVHELQVHQVELEMQNEELQQARAKMEALVAQYTELYDFAPTGYFSLDREGAIRQVNLSGAHLLGLERSRLVKRRFGAFVAESEHPVFGGFLQKVFASRGKECCEVALLKAGHPPLFVRIEGLVSEDGQECRAVVLDLTGRRQGEEQARATHTETQRLLALSEQSRRALLSVLEDQKRAELALSRQKNLYHVLSQSNKAVVQLASRDELFATVCRIAVEHGRFRFAWIGLIDNDDPRLKPVARYGEDNGYIDQLNLSGNGASALRRGLTGRTLLSGTYVISNDFLNDPAMVPWHEAARRAGVGASAKFPIRQAGVVIGAINLYAGEPGFFTNDLVATLDEIARDVSFALDNYAREAARKQAEALLRHSEQRLRTVLQTSMDSFWVADTEGRFLDVNDAYCRLIGYEREALLNMRIPDVEAMESPEDTARHIRELMTKGHDLFETRHRCKDGRVLDVEVSANFMSDRDGGCFFAFMRDITERKRTGEALRAAEEQFRGLVEQSIAGTYIVQDGRFAYVNPRFAAILGYDCADELIGRDPLSLTAEQDRAMVAENMRRRLEGEVASVAYSVTAQRKDGSMIELGVHGAGATYRGRPAIIGLMQDITEKKRAEQQIQRYIAQLENTFMRVVEIARTLSEIRDPYTAGHERRVGEIAAAIGAELGFDARRVEGLRVAGYLHDIGKITIPAEILAKPGTISPAEFLLIKGHAQASYDILKGVEFPWPVAQIALQHHERMDGSGYPQGLKGEAILLEARILAVADVLEAMATHRPYRPALGIDKALAEIERGRGTAYDANIADACLRLLRDKGYSIPP